MRFFKERAVFCSKQVLFVRRRKNKQERRTEKQEEQDRSIFLCVVMSGKTQWLSNKYNLFVLNMSELIYTNSL